MKAIIGKQAEYAGALLEEGGNELKAVRRINKKKDILPLEEHAMTEYCKSNPTVQEMYQETLKKFKQELMESYIHKRRKLRQIMDICIPDDVKDFSQLDPDTCIKAFAVGIKATDISNKMEGHYPKESADFRPIERDQDIERVNRLTEELAIIHKSEI